MKAANTLVILSDEHQARAMGCAGHSVVRTPHLDALAARGTRFLNAVTPCPICVPARAAFATGLPVHACGYWDNSFGYDGRVPGWGHAMQAAGIPVESIGKLHYRDKNLPTGFDAEHIPMHLHNGVGAVWASIRDPLGARPRGTRMLGPYVGPGESDYTRYDRSVTELAAAWLREKGRLGAQPWCLYVGLVAPHFPLVAPEEFYNLYAGMAAPACKLHPADGHALHPWPRTHDDFWSHEADFRDDEERRRAFAAYYGLVSWMDYNVGCILSALEEAGLRESTRVIYTSDHGENLGARGLWGKSNLYRESVDVPLIIAGPDIPVGLCATAVSLLDVSTTLLESVGLDSATALAGRPGRSLLNLAGAPDDPDRAVLSEYHALGSNNGGFMLRKGRWKFHYYVAEQPELFDLETDPEELHDLAGQPAYAGVLARMESELRMICDPEAVDRAAKADQRALVARIGGAEAALGLSKAMSGATPPPKI